jgi:FixJ family two-component response regulator
MRTGRPKEPLILTEEERERLESLAHRARVVLGCAEGLGNDTVARKLRCSVGMVGRWRARCTTSRGPERRAPSAMPRLSRL